MSSRNLDQDFRGRDRKNLSSAERIKREGSHPTESWDPKDRWWLALLTKETLRSLEAYERKA